MLNAANGPRLRSNPSTVTSMNCVAKYCKWCEDDSFAFFFVDPSGWKDVAPDTLSPLLQRPKSEYLINFMFDFINRFYTEAALELFGTIEDLSSMVAENVKSI